MHTSNRFRYPVALTVAGSDSGGGAGIQADLKTFSALGLYGISALTAVTAQNTKGIRRFEAVDPSLLRDQLEALADDFTIDAIKIGMLPTAGSVQVVAGLLDCLPSLPAVLDPVLVSSSGSKLIDDHAIGRMRELLFPRISLLTPNTVEAAFLTGRRVDTEEDRQAAAVCLLEAGCRAVLMKGGHVEGEKKTDVLFVGHTPMGQAESSAPAGRTSFSSTSRQAAAGIGSPLRFESPAISTPNTHGTGCTLSSAIAAYLALGCTLAEAVGKAKRYMTQALENGKDVRIGGGTGPVNHFFAPLPLKKISEGL